MPTECMCRTSLIFVRPPKFRYSKHPSPRGCVFSLSVCRSYVVGGLCFFASFVFFKRFSGTLTRTTAAAFNSPSGALGPRARSANSCALRRVTTPGPVVGGTTSRPARMRGRWTDSSSSRARALLTAARALQQECRKPQCGIVRLPHRAAAAPLLLGHHRELGGPLRGRGQHSAGSLLRAGADRGCGLKALPADLWPGACQTAGPNTPALARATAPDAGWDISS